MGVNMKKIIEDMGWSNGFYIPVANSENLELEARIEQLTANKLKLTFNDEALSEKLSALEKYLKNITKEQEENQNLLFARHSQLDSEKKLYLLTKKEKDSLSSETKELVKEYEKCEARKQTKYKDLNGIVNKLDKLKVSIEWDEDAIDNWENTLNKKYEDNHVIRKYFEEDKKKAKELEIKRYHLQEEEYSRKQLVIRTSKELDSLELILTRNIQMYKQLHEERSNLLKQWQEAVSHLKQRDDDTLAISREIINIKELNETKLDVLEQNKEFYKNELNNNKEIELEIENLETEVKKLRSDVSNCCDITRQYNMELDTMKREIQKTSEMLQKERIYVKKLHDEQIQKTGQLESIIVKIQELKVEMKRIEETSITSTERLKTLKELIRTEESIQKGLFADIENMQHTIFRSQQILNNLIEFNKLKNVELQANQQGVQLLEREKEHLDKDLIIQKEQNYKINYRMALLKSKLTRLTGSDNREHSVEDDLNEQKLTELEEKCNEVLKLSNLLQTEQLRIEDIMRQLTAAITVDTEKIVKMKDTLQTQMLLVEGAIKSVAEKKNLQQQHQVDENVLKVRLNHAEKALKQEGNHIYSLQRQQLELESMMKDRESEIRITKEMLLAKRNALNEDTSKLRIDIQGCRMKTVMLKKRFDSILSSFGKTEDGEVISASYFKVKNAQEKHLLQEQGDKLDNEIRKAEKEIIAMENTLKAVNICNDSFKKSLTLVNENDEESSEMKQIHTQIYAQTKLLRQNRNNYQKKENILKNIQDVLQNKKQQLEELEAQVTDYENNLSLLQSEAVNRIDKLKRAEKQINKIISTKKLDTEQKQDFYAHQLQDFNKCALQQLSETSSKYLETRPLIKHYLLENNLALSVSSVSSLSRSCSSLSYSSASSNQTIAKVTLKFDDQI